jgi:hypothetical protein
MDPLPIALELGRRSRSLELPKTQSPPHDHGRSSAQIALSRLIFASSGLRGLRMGAVATLDGRQFGLGSPARNQMDGKVKTISSDHP